MGLVLITGADAELGRLATQRLAGEHALRLTGAGEQAGEVPAGLEYSRADLREKDAAAALVAGVERILHLAPYTPPVVGSPAEEKEALDVASRGTYELTLAAIAAGVKRVVLASRLEVLSGYPEEYVVDEQWKPLPEPTAAGLSPYLSELVLREAARTGRITGLCLRFGPLGFHPSGTTPEDAVTALERALFADLSGYKYPWGLFHVCSGGRYPCTRASEAPLGLTFCPTD